MVEEFAVRACFSSKRFQICRLIVPPSSEGIVRDKVGVLDEMKMDTLNPSLRC